MACQVCNHTMQSVAPKLFWCAHCGSLKKEHKVLDSDFSIPKIVKHAIELYMASHYCRASDKGPEAARLDRAEKALAECCMLPNERS